jgi:hypothetical protein
MYSHINSKEYPISVVNAFDSLKEQRRKLFDISEINGFLSFENRKNLYIVRNGGSVKLRKNLKISFLFIIYDTTNKKKNGT